MIKIATIGMLDDAKLNSTLTSESAVANYTFLTNNGIVYLVANTVTGDDSYVYDVTFAAGEMLNGWQLDAWVGQKLIVDEKHIAYASGADYDDLTAGTTLLKINANGKLEVTSTAPESGNYFKVTNKVYLTEKAVEVVII